MANYHDYIVDLNNLNTMIDVSLEICINRYVIIILITVYNDNLYLNKNRIRIQELTVP